MRPRPDADDYRTLEELIYAAIEWRLEAAGFPLGPLPEAWEPVQAQRLRALLRASWNRNGQRNPLDAAVDETIRRGGREPEE